MLTIQPNEDYILSILKKLLDTPSPSGFTAQVMNLVAEEAAALNVPLSWNEKGGVILTVPGLDPSRTIGISAHVDTLGAMVRSIKPNGTLRLTSVGGFTMSSIENEYCVIHTNRVDLHRHHSDQPSFGPCLSGCARFQTR